MNLLYILIILELQKRCLAMANPVFGLAGPELGIEPKRARNSCCHVLAHSLGTPHTAVLGGMLGCHSAVGMHRPDPGSLADFPGKEVSGTTGPIKWVWRLPC